MLPDGGEPDERNFKTVTSDKKIGPLDTVRSFFLDTISESGKSALFAKELVQVTELTQEVLTLIMPEILFKFGTPSALVEYAQESLGRFVYIDAGY